MINRNEFQAAAKRFRGGRISLSEFTEATFDRLGQQTIQRSLGEGISALQLPIRAKDAHKGDFGHALFIGGSESMPGAIALSAMAAQRAGSGLATVITSMAAQPIVAGFSPCLMTIGAFSDSGTLSASCLPDILAVAAKADVIAIGPGMGRTPDCQEIVSSIYQDLPQPVVVDADAINNLADGRSELSRHAGPRILTPHPGEFARITGTNIGSRIEMEERASALARSNGIIVVLKGAGTFVTDGDMHYHNTSGNSAMATAGSGDVLTGIITSLIGQRLNPLASAQTGCYLHGLAGDLWLARQASAPMIATDLIDLLPAAIAQLAGQIAKESN